MAEYQMTQEKWTCKCGQSGYDIVPVHACPLEDCAECGQEYNTNEEGDETLCGECIEDSEEE